MTAINASSTSSSTSRISGLASGLDTESLVEDLTAATRAKIEKSQQQKQILEWKQEDYRGILTKLVDFNNKYFGTSSGTISIGESLCRLTASSSNTGYISAVAGTTAKSNSVYISNIVSMATAAKIQSSATVSPDLAFTLSLDNLANLGSKSMKVSLDDLSETITFSDITYSTGEDVANELNSRLEDAFGAGRVTVSAADGKLTFSAAANSIIRIADSGNEGNEALAVLGFTDSDLSSNRLDLSKTLADYSQLFGSDTTFEFSINGQDFSFANTTSLSKIITSINSSSANVKISYSNISDTFAISSKETGTGSNIETTDLTGSFIGTILGGSGITTAGTNAVVKLSLDGSTQAADQITITRNTNTFSVDGTTYTITGMAGGTIEEGVTVKTALDTDSIVEKIKSFVDDYNTLLGAINGKISEERDGDFQPLTDSQKDELSDDEAKTWNEKARIGWLRNDIYLNDITTSLRSSLYTKVESLDSVGDDIGLILSDIGITTSDYTENGKLRIDEDKLRTALAKDTEKVLRLFTQQSSISYSLYNSSENKTQRYNESGLLWRINDIVKGNINAVGKKGALVGLVGNPSNGYIGTYTYSERLNQIEEKIGALKDKLEDEEKYFWSKFTSMETSLSSLNAQSAWLTSQLTSY